MHRLRKTVKLGLNIIRELLNQESVEHYYNQMAQKQLAPAQVDGYMQCHKDTALIQFGEGMIESIMLLTDVNDRVLDVGCGTGRYLAALTNQHPLNLYGIDISQATIKNYTKVHSHPSTRLAVADLTRTGVFAPKQFNLIYSIAVLQHIPFRSAMSFLKNVPILLLPDGYFYLVFAPAENWLSYFSGVNYYRYPPHFLNEKLQQLGLKIVKSEYIFVQGQPMGYRIISQKVGS